MIIIETCPQCGHDLFDSVIDVMPPIYRKEFLNCGWNSKEMQESVIRVPFDGNVKKDMR